MVLCIIRCISPYDKNNDQNHVRRGEGTCFHYVIGKAQWMAATDEKVCCCRRMANLKGWWHRANKEFSEAKSIELIICQLIGMCNKKKERKQDIDFLWTYKGIIRAEQNKKENQKNCLLDVICQKKNAQQADILPQQVNWETLHFSSSAFRCEWTL